MQTVPSKLDGGFYFGCGEVFRPCPLLHRVELKDEETKCTTAHKHRTLAKRMQKGCHRDFPRYLKCTFTRDTSTETFP
jgi:hypothetical protein